MRSDQLQRYLEEYIKPQSDCLVLRYLGIPQIAVRGTVTRSLYRFSANQPVQPVDARDAKGMLASRLFGISS